MVYGDIGTSPLYTLRACLNTIDDLQPARIAGVLSILFWLLMIVVSLRYVTLVLRADNRGEGGTLALLELAVRGREAGARWLLIVLGIFGAALFYGDSMITPAIFGPVGARRHQHRVAQLEPWVVPVALVVLVACLPSVARHRRGGQAVRPHHGAVVRDAGGIGRVPGLVDAGGAEPRSTRCGRCASSPSSR